MINLIHIKYFLRKYDHFLTFGLFFKIILWLKTIFIKEKEIVESPKLNYLDRLGIRDIENKEQSDKLKEAYNRANHNRDFEIDKFWSRAAYFWSFIAIIFAVYFTFLTTELDSTKTSLLKDLKQEFHHIELYIICMGLIFAFAWRYIILGSKQWQENWESHIDQLEKYITGDLYKTIFKKNKFYSVSKINLILSNVIIVVWSCILLSYIKRCRAFPDTNENINWDISLPIIFAIYIILQFMYGYGRTQIDEERFIKYPL